jgi:hypothetical protein
MGTAPEAIVRGVVWALLVLVAAVGPPPHGARPVTLAAVDAESVPSIDPWCEGTASMAAPSSDPWAARTRVREVGSDGEIWELEYDVAPGDTLWRIASHFDVPVVWLTAANGLDDPRRIRMGQRLRIPQGLPPVDPRLLARVPAALRGSPERLRLAAHFQRWAKVYRIEPALLMALAWVESGWQHAVVSHRGAIGIGQLIPETVDFVSEGLLGLALDPWTPEQNIQMSARFLRYLLDETDGDVAQALAAYYQGLGALRTSGMLEATRPYVTSVLATRRFFDAG